MGAVGWHIGAKSSLYLIAFIYADLPAIRSCAECRFADSHAFTGTGDDERTSYLRVRIHEGIDDVSAVGLHFPHVVGVAVFRFALAIFPDVEGFDERWICLPVGGVVIDADSDMIAGFNWQVDHVAPLEKVIHLMGSEIFCPDDGARTRGSK